jgi:hypothetical protein
MKHSGLSRFWAAVLAVVAASRSCSDKAKQTARQRQPYVAGIAFDNARDQDIGLVPLDRSFGQSHSDFAALAVNHGNQILVANGLPQNRTTFETEELARSIVRELGDSPNSVQQLLLQRGNRRDALITIGETYAPGGNPTAIVVSTSIASPFTS